MSVIKAKNSNGEWEVVASVKDVEASTGGELAYAVLTHNTGNTTGLMYRTFDLTNYIPAGTIYFMTQYGSTAPGSYVCIIKDGDIVAQSYETNKGTMFDRVGETLQTTPTFELTDGIMKITGTTQSNLKDYADVIYVA